MDKREELYGGTSMFDLQSAHIMCLYPNYIFRAEAQFNGGF